MNDQAIEKLWELAPPETPETPDAPDASATPGAPKTPAAAERLRAFEEALTRDVHAAEAWRREARWLGALGVSAASGAIPGTIPGATPGAPDAMRFAQRVLERLGPAPAGRVSTRTKWNAAIFSAVWVSVALGVALALRYNQGPPPRPPGAEMGQDTISIAVEGVSDQAERMRKGLVEFFRNAQSWRDYAPSPMPAGGPAPRVAAPGVAPAARPAVLAVLSGPTPGHDAARLAPANTGLYLEAENLSGWEDTLDADPVVRAFWRLMPDFHNTQGYWQSLQENLGMTGDEFINRYFGKSLAVISPEPGPGAPLLLLSRVDEADGAYLVKQLGLVTAGQTGKFKVYATRDGAVEIALGQGWLVLGQGESGAYMDAVLSQPDSAARLADDATFKQWTGKLGANPAALLYGVREKPGQVHAAAMFRRQDGEHFEYVGKSADFAGLPPLLGKSGVVTFGPLPRDAAGTAVLNVRGLTAAQAAVVDRVLGPGKFEADLLPRLEGPVVLFVGPAPSRDALGQGPVFPPAGLMVKMRDPAVAGDLDRIITQLMLAANVAALRGENQPKIELRQGVHEGAAYSVAEIGGALAARLDWPQADSTQLVYGQAGDWYVVCTQEKFYQSILDAPKAGGFDVSGLGLAKVDRPVATAAAQGEALSQIMALWVMRWRQDHPQAPLFMSPREMSPEMFRVRQTAIISRTLMHYRGMTFQLQSVGDDELRADLDIKNGDMTLDTRF